MEGEHVGKFTEWPVTFEAPAFLGNVVQKTQWRTHPFKALIHE